MPRAKRPRLWLKPATRFADGYERTASWVILDRGRHIATGCAEGEAERADRALAAYIGTKYTPNRKTRSIEQILVAEVLTLYDAEIGAQGTEQDKFDARLKRLNEFFGALTLADVGPVKCEEYRVRRGTDAGARRDLEDLRAAINYHADSNLHREIVTVTLPAKGNSRDRWLTRHEAAVLLWTCWRTREVQKASHKGLNDGATVVTDKYPLRHLVRLILIGLYTGSRYGAIAAASPESGIGRSWVDLDRGIFHRLRRGAKRTNKRQPPVRLPDRLLAHMRRWARLDPDMDYFLAWRGKPVGSVKVGLTRAARLAGIEHVYPHVLRHTAATWLMQAGVSIWEAAGFLGMSEKVLRDVYGHHHPDFQRGAADAIGYRRPVGKQARGAA